MLDVWSCQSHCVIQKSLRCLVYCWWIDTKLWKLIIQTPVISLLRAENNEHGVQHPLFRNPTFNLRQLYQYSQPHYELSVCLWSLKQHCEQYLLSLLVMPSILSNENYGTPKCKGLWKFKMGLLNQRRSCLSLYNQNTAEQDLLTVLFQGKAMRGTPFKKQFSLTWCHDVMSRNTQNLTNAAREPA